MEKRKKLLILATAISAIAAIVLIVTSLATEKWVQSTPSLASRKNYTTENNEVSFGLFKGKKVLNFGFASRPTKLDSKLFFVAN